MMTKRGYVKRDGQTMTTISMRVEMEFKKRLEEKCIEEGKSMSQTIMELLNAYMEGKACIMDGFTKETEYEEGNEVYKNYRWTDPTLDHNSFVVTVLDNKIVDSVIK